MSKYFLGIDQGTTGVTAMLFDKAFAPIARGYCEITQYYPDNGWVEHDPENIWEVLKTNSDLFQIKSEIVLIKSDFVLRVSHYFLPCRKMRSFA